MLFLITNLLNHTLEKDLHGLSSRMRTYVQSFDNTKKFSAIIEELKLTEEEAPRFEKFIDRITENYMDIPVELHEQFFDFTTLNNLKTKRDLLLKKNLNRQIFRRHEKSRMN